MPPSYSLFLLTFNCARLPQHPQSLSAALTPHIPSPLPDLILISLQELLPIPDSFLSGTYLPPYLTPLLTGITASLPPSTYGDPIFHHLGPTALLIFSLAPLSSVEYAALGLGPFGVSSKGGVSARLTLPGPVTITATALHLSPHETRHLHRDAEWAALVRSLVFADGSQIYPRGRREYGFVFGDLNYRSADARPVREEVVGWRGDQLVRAMREGRSMHGLTEAAVRFPVTYKYKVREGGGTVKNRWPSWTDRILFWPNGVSAGVYGAVMEYCGSDHKMVYLEATVGVEDGMAVDPPFEPEDGGRERREAARRVEVVVGTVWLAGGSYVVWAVVFAVGIGGWWAWNSIQV